MSSPSRAKGVSMRLLRQHRAVLAASSLAVLACLPWGMGKAQTNQPGKARYVATGCFQCHGYEGQGGVAGPRIAPSPYPYLAFAQLVRRPANVMPAYSAAVLDDDTLRAIFDYVVSIPEPAALEDIPALQ
jgi:ubiquinol-cytochrome c reductase cytochrome c subunit